MKIGVISDTHGCFDGVLRKFLAGVDEIWHAGDFGSIETADAIATFKPLKGVCGNIDGGATRIVYPERLVWDCEGVRVLMMHIGGYPGRYDRAMYEWIRRSGAGLVVAGHSHILRVQYDKVNSLLFLNPGAAGCAGFHGVRTAIRMEIADGRVTQLEVGEWLKHHRP